MNRMVGKLLEIMGGTGGRSSVPAWWSKRAVAAQDDDPQLAPLRLFCRLRGIELPYRAEADHGKRAAGFAAAMERAVAEGRPDLVVVISSLEGIVEDEPAAARAIARARRAAGQVVVLVPSPARFAPAAVSDAAARVRSVLARDAQLAFEAARRVLARHGVTVMEVGPTDTPAALFGRTVGARRRVA
jgi:hypothetical protein